MVTGAQQADEQTGETVITRTSRLARDLLHRRAIERARRGRSVAETPAVYSVEAWLESLWESTRPRRIALTAAAERVLWEQIIEADARDHAEALPADMAELLDRSSLARLAAEACKRINDYGEPPPAEAFATMETEAFARWRRAFAQRLDERGWLSRAQLVAEVCAAVAGGGVAAPEAVAFVGFERSWPALESLVHALRARGCQVRADWERQPPALRAVQRVDAYVTPLDEVRAVAREIREALHNARDTQIGVVAADLSAARPLFERVLAEELNPASALLDDLDSPRRFDLAGAPALGDYALIAHALDLLSLGRSGNEFALLGRVLLAPYPRPPRDGAEAAHDDHASRAQQTARAEEAEDRGELEARARTELDLRDHGYLRASLAQISSALVRAGAARMALRVDGLAALLDDDAPAAPRVWAERFSRRLRAMGWPGHDLSETEGVAYARWGEVLGELASLGAVTATMSRPQALARIRELAADHLVQAPSLGLGVQVMGVLDAAGLRFDRLYLVGFHARAFPAPVAPHALLPVAWQVAEGHPRASASAELRFAERIWRGLLASAPEVFASFAVQGEGDEPRQPSPFLSAPGSSMVSEIRAVDVRPWYRPDANAAAEYLYARPSDSSPQALILRGGTGLLADESACPFRALAARRLGCEALQAPVPVPAADVLGRMVHAALAVAWQELEDSRSLRALDGDELASLAERVAALVVADGELAVAPALRPTNSRWLAELVAAWLVYEASKRVGDWRVLACETSTAISLAGGVELEPIRIDRVDELADGRLLIIDYKTSSSASTVRKWLGERPEDPQLPLYALALAANGSDDGRVAPGREVAAVAFANLAARNELSLKGPPDFELVQAGGGRSARSEEWPGWPEQLANWARALGDLAIAYSEGRTSVDPIDKACDYCRRQPLCRLFEGETTDDEGGGQQ